MRRPARRGMNVQAHDMSDFPGNILAPMAGFGNVKVLRESCGYSLSVELAGIMRESHFWSRGDSRRNTISMFEKEQNGRSPFPSLPRELTLGPPPASDFGAGPFNCGLWGLVNERRLGGDHRGRTRPLRTTRPLSSLACRVCQWEEMGLTPHATSSENLT